MNDLISYHIVVMSFNFNLNKIQTINNNEVGSTYNTEASCTRSVSFGGRVRELGTSSLGCNL